MVAAMLESWKARLVSLTLLALTLRALWVAFEPATSPQADETMWLPVSARFRIAAYSRASTAPGTRNSRSVGCLPAESFGDG